MFCDRNASRLENDDRVSFIIKPEHRETIREIAQKKANALRGGPKTTVFVRDNDLIGVAAEYAFALTFGYKMRHNFNRRGDGGYDFLVSSSSDKRIKKLDVKGTRERLESVYRKRAPALIVKRGELKADIYVLISVCLEHWSYDFEGWAWAFEVEEGTKVGPPQTICHNWRIENILLNKISDLAPLVNRRAALDPQLLA